MTPLYKLFKATTFRLSLIFLLMFGVSAAFGIGYIYWNANVLLIRQLNQTVEAEIQGLAEHYRQGGLPFLVQTVAERSRIAGNSLYLVTDRTGRYLAGNLRVTKPIWNAKGNVRFSYQRPAPGGAETRHAYAKTFRLIGDFRLLVGRDIEERRRFEKVIRDVMVGLAMFTLLGIIGGWLVSRNILSRIDAVTDTSKSIMDGDLSERIPVNGSGDELDRLSTNLNEMLDKIERLMTGLREVSDNIAHDLKTPLNRMRNRVDAALHEPEIPAKQKMVLESIIEDTDGLIRTFNSLLSIARLEAGTGSTSIERIKLTDIMSDLAELYEPVLEEHEMILKTDFALELEIKADRQLIGQAVANLMDNAVKYAGAAKDCKKEVNLITELDKDVVRIIVADYGPGIPEQDRGRVLKRFVRLDKSRSLPGTGLGLSLVAAVTHLHGGKLILEDNNPGLKAIIQLPAIKNT